MQLDEAKSSLQKQFEKKNSHIIVNGVKDIQTRVFDASLQRFPIEPVNYTHDFMRVLASLEHQQESWRYLHALFHFCV